MLIGNLFVFYQFQGKDHIDESTRSSVFIVLTAVAIVGVIFLGLLRRVHHTYETTADGDRDLDYKPRDNSAISAFKNAIKLFFTRDMLLLSITFLYTGLYYMCPGPIH